MNTFTFSAETTQKLINYLAARPLQEVLALFNEVSDAVKAQQAAMAKEASTEAHKAISNGSDAV